MITESPPNGLGRHPHPSGIAWKAASQVTLQVSRMVVALVLARLLAPHDWGLAAMVFAFPGFVVVFTDNAFGTALIQRRDAASRRTESTVFWISAGIGLVPRARRDRVAGPLADFYGEPAVRSLFVAFCRRLLRHALGTTQMALLVREMQFRRLELRQIAATLVGARDRHRVALLGYGAWAIVGAATGGGGDLDRPAVVCSTRGGRQLDFSMASVRRLGGFAGNVFGENLLYQAGRNLSSLLIGRFLGAAALGAYALATNVILMPVRPHRGPAAAGLLPRLLAHARRPRAHGGHVDSRDPSRRRHLDPVARRPRDGRSGLRPGRARPALERGDAGDPDPRAWWASSSPCRR